MLILSLVFIFGCATTTEVQVSRPATPGFYYRVVRFDTLYTISKTYGVDLEILASVNNISDTSQLEVGQRIFIPSQTVPEPAIQRRVPAPAYSVSKDSFAWPVKGKVIAYFNQKFAGVLNKGLNIKTLSEQEVSACFDGVVSFKGELPNGLGSTIIIQHNDRISTVYNNLSAVFINIGDKVTKGQLVAKVGISPRDNIPYLHFEVRDGSVARNPLYYLP